MIFNFDAVSCTTSISLEQIASLQKGILDSNGKYEISFDIEQRIGLTFLFCLTTLPLYAECNNKKISITCNSKILDLLYKSDYIDDRITDTDLDIAPLLNKKNIRISSQNDVFQLVSKITKEAPVEMSDELFSLFASKIGEMYNNAIEHSESQYIVGAKYFKNQKNIYCFSCYDFGVGIAQKVINAVPEINDSKAAFEWAMKAGNSTKVNASSNIPRGLGLGLLKDFAKANNGSIRMCCNDVYYEFKNGKDNIVKINSCLAGTLFEMDIIADNNHKYIIR